jgi:hypothetical protein
VVSEQWLVVRKVADNEQENQSKADFKLTAHRFFTA